MTDRAFQPGNRIHTFARFLRAGLAGNFMPGELNSFRQCFGSRISYIEDDLMVACCAQKPPCLTVHHRVHQFPGSRTTLQHATDGRHCVLLSCLGTSANTAAQCRCRRLKRS